MIEFFFKYKKRLTIVSTLIAVGLFVTGSLLTTPDSNWGRFGSEVIWWAGVGFLAPIIFALDSAYGKMKGNETLNNTSGWGPFYWGIFFALWSLNILVGLIRCIASSWVDFIRMISGQ